MCTLRLRKDLYFFKWRKRFWSSPKKDFNRLESERREYPKVDSVASLLGMEITISLPRDV